MLIKNILPESYKTELENLICRDNFPWYWSSGTIYGNEVKAEEELLFQFTHVFYHKDKGGINSNLYQNISPIIHFFEKETNFKVKSIHKIKANLLTKSYATDKEIKACLHRDIESSNLKEQDKKYVSFVYYVTDSDGDTVIFDDDLKEIERASPVAGNLVWFKSTLPHYAIPPKVNKRRVIINFVLELE